MRYALLGALLSLSALTLQAQPFSLEDILSAPYVETAVFAPETSRVAWIVNQEGVRNIWIADAPDFRPVPVTHYTEDDGQVLGNLTFTPDGRLLLYVRGGSPNRRGEYPNPRSLPDGVRREVWVVELATGRTWSLGEGTNPIVSPDGRLVLFSRRGTLYRIVLHPDSTRARPLFRARGSTQSPVWSPDGRYVAFVSNRGAYSFIGVYDTHAHRIRWLAPGVDRDMDPVWSPDSRRLAFIRQPGLKKGERYNLMAGYPFQILIAEVATGEARVVWESPGRDGGFAQYYPAEPLRWLPNGRLLFYSEHEGWMHIYSLDPDRGTLTDLTPGEAEAEHSIVSRDGAWLYFSGNHNDIDRRHLWRVSTTGGRPELLTPGTGIETDPLISPDGRWLIYRAATARRPQGLHVLDLQTRAVRRIFPEQLPERFPEAHLVEPEPVVFSSLDGLTLHGQLFRPPDLRSGERRPAVIFLHGGPIRQMLLGWHYRGYYARAYALNQYLAARGYVVLALNYRTGIGYGRAFRLAARQGPRGASEYQDVVAAALFLRHLPGVDPDRIGLWGGSYGGYLTAMGLARDSELFAAGVDLHGVHDWAFRATDFSPGGGWGIADHPDSLALAYRSSPVADIDRWRSPVLLIHGDDDRNVLFEQTVDLAQRLRERGVHVELLVLPDEVHSFLLHESWLRAYHATVDFLDRMLRDRPLPFSNH
ncbi:MAG: S9 family peptidase [Rhodothermus sp.]|nr:S9 family peptidase [Rhodothermus sp.]